MMRVQVEHSALPAVQAVMARELKSALRRPGDALQPLLFLALVVTLFPLGLGPDPARLALIAPAAVWIAALLASELHLERLFREDYDDGSLELAMTSGQNLALLVCGKVAAHWLLTGLPMSLLGALAGLALNLSYEVSLVLALSLLLGTPVLSLLGSIGSALTVSLPRGGLLLALLVLPLYVPVLIFGTAAVVAAQSGVGSAAELKMLGAMLCLAIPACPFAAAVALRISTA